MRAQNWKGVAGEGGRARRSAPVIERADLTRLEPPVDAVEVESVLHGVQADCQLGGWFRSTRYVEEVVFWKRDGHCTLPTPPCLPGGSSRKHQYQCLVLFPEDSELCVRTFIGRRGTLVRLTFDACAERKVTTKVVGSVPARRSWRKRGRTKVHDLQEWAQTSQSIASSIYKGRQFRVGSDLENSVRSNLGTHMVPADGAVVDDNVLCVRTRGASQDYADTVGSSWR